MAAQLRNVDALIARTAARQNGAMSRAQLLAAGATRHQVQQRVESGALLPTHRGVYVVALARGKVRGLQAAAVLACGPGSLLGLRTAAGLWHLPVDPCELIEVITPGRDRDSLNGVRTYSITALHSSERRQRHGLPVASPSLTVLDLAGLLGREALAAVVNEARVLQLVREEELQASLVRHPKRRGARNLRRLLSQERGAGLTRSEAERRALALMRRHDLHPETDVSIGPWRVDFLFRSERVVVEVDGYRYHSTPKRFVDDRRRAADLAARGFVVLSLTWSDLGAESGVAIARLRQTLDRRREFPEFDR
jgi:very-short-patch-repair endonuclease